MITDAIVVGGAELFVVFFEEARRTECSRLLCVLPFVDAGAFAQPEFARAWRQVLPSLDGVCVVRTAAAAQALLASMPLPRRVEVRIHHDAHAKAAVASGPRGELVLVGSQNLTGAAFTKNAEVGLILRAADAPADIAQAARRVRVMVKAIVRDSAPVSTGARSGGGRAAATSAALPTAVERARQAGTRCALSRFRSSQ